MKASLRPNCPHKLTKTAEPWLGGEAALGGSELHGRVTSAAVRSRHCMLVAAAAAPLSGSRHGRRLLQLRVIALGGRIGIAAQQGFALSCHSTERTFRKERDVET